MKKSIFFLLLFFTVSAAAQQPGPDDCLPIFRNGSPKESLNLFREYFRTTYLDEFARYRKANKATYKYRKGDFQDIRMIFYIDTLGVSHLLETRPKTLTPVQRQVLEQTFERLPKWTPAVQKGRKVKVRYTIDVIE